MQKLRTRIRKLEEAQGKDKPEPFALLVQVIPAKGDVRVTGATLQDSPARFAMIGAGPFGAAENLHIDEGESESNCLLRVEATVQRIFGHLPANWTMQSGPIEQATI